MANDAPQQPVSFSSVFSFASRRITLSRKNGIVGGHCTGFLWERGGTLHLITNWHCVTNWHPIGGHCLDTETGFDPEVASFSVMLSSDGGKSADGQQLILTSDQKMSVELRVNGQPNWLEHPTFGRKVDVVAIKLGPGPKNLFSTPINSHSYQEAVISAGDEAFVIGYPLKDINVAIWKRASIATEPDIDIDDLPKMLIDTATRPGMSGSPVLAMHRGGFLGKDRIYNLIGGNTKTFLGVYSSRIGDESSDLQLGEVWKAAVIDEIIDGSRPGKGPHD